MSSRRFSGMTRRRWLALTSAAAALTLSPKRGAEGAFPASEADLLRLDLNENPYGPSEAVRQTLSGALGESCRYPFSLYPEVSRLIAARVGLSPEHVLVGAGSSEILALAGLVYGLPGGEVVSSWPTFPGLLNYASSVGSQVHRVPLTQDLQQDLDALEGRLTPGVRLVFVCNPNNPTGAVLPGGALKGFCREVSRRAVVFVDEAYHEYAEDAAYASMVDLVREGKNVIVSRTFSKIHGLAGLRIGFGLARPDIVKRLREFRMSAGNVLGLRAAMTAVEELEFESYSRGRNRAAQRIVYSVLDRLGLLSVRSHANFIFFDAGRPARELAEEMSRKGILVGRPFPPYTNWCRVSMGKIEEMERFAEALETAIRG